MSLPVVWVWMNPLLRAYRLAAHAGFAALFPPFCLFARLSGRHADGLEQRAGLFSPKLKSLLPPHPRIWLHAASVGEARMAVQICRALEKLCPGCGLILSTITPHGLTAAKQAMGKTAVCVLAPLDAPWAVRRAMAFFKPDAMVFLETELWPNWILEAARTGVPAALIHGRVSVRSIRGYLKIKSLMHPVLSTMAAFSMIRDADAGRIRQMGAPASRVVVNGNAKFDLRITAGDERAASDLAKTYGLAGRDRVWVAGSTRHPEEDGVLDAFLAVRKEFPDATLVLAPRHVHRAGKIKRMAENKGIDVRLRSRFHTPGDNPGARVILVDEIGELRLLYGLAQVVFCGGSLAAKGGQNILEPAVWAKPVLHGPHMDDFADAADLLRKAGGSAVVADATDLARRVAGFFRHPDKARKMGQKAGFALAQNRGAALKHARVIVSLIQES